MVGNLLTLILEVRLDVGESAYCILDGLLKVIQVV